MCRNIQFTETRDGRYHRSRFTPLPGTLPERLRKRVYKTRELARADIFDYIEVFYNRQRRHDHLGGVSPVDFEAASL